MLLFDESHNEFCTISGVKKRRPYSLWKDRVEKYGLIAARSRKEFRDNLKSFIEQVVSRHEPIKVTRRAGEDFVVVSAEDWEREQETLYVLQNSDLMKQIAGSIATHTKNQGYKPTEEEMDEITGI